MNSELMNFIEKLVSLLEVPDGAPLQERVDEVMIELQSHVTSPADRKMAACLLAERAFDVLIRTFAGCSESVTHENKELFLAFYHVFHETEADEEPILHQENAIDMLRRMQEECGKRKGYETCESYFRYYQALCNDLSQSVKQTMMRELRIIALPYLAETLECSEALPLRARRAIIVAKSVFRAEIRDNGSALLLLEAVQGELFGLVPEYLRSQDVAHLEVVYGILCKAADMAPATFYLPLAHQVEQEIYSELCVQTGNVSFVSGDIPRDISALERLLWQKGEPLPLKLRSMLKLHHFHAILLRGGCLPEWDEL